MKYKICIKNANGICNLSNCFYDTDTEVLSSGDDYGYRRAMNDIELIMSTLIFSYFSKSKTSDVYLYDKNIKDIKDALKWGDIKHIKYNPKGYDYFYYLDSETTIACAFYRKTTFYGNIKLQDYKWPQLLLTKEGYSKIKNINFENIDKHDLSNTKYMNGTLFVTNQKMFDILTSIPLKNKKIYIHDTQIHHFTEATKCDISYKGITKRNWSVITYYIERYKSCKITNLDTGEQITTNDKGEIVNTTTINIESSNRQRIYIRNSATNLYYDASANTIIMDNSCTITDVLSLYFFDNRHYPDSTYNYSDETRKPVIYKKLKPEVIDYTKIKNVIIPKSIKPLINDVFNDGTCIFTKDNTPVFISNERFNSFKCIKIITNKKYSKFTVTKDNLELSDDANIMHYFTEEQYLKDVLYPKLKTVITDKLSIIPNIRGTESCNFIYVGQKFYNYDDAIEETVRVLKYHNIAPTFRSICDTMQVVLIDENGIIKEQLI